MLLPLLGNLLVIARPYKKKMCLGVAYSFQDMDYRVYFSDPLARLPVKKKSGKEALVIWGRRKYEESNLPLGGRALLTDIHAGYWNQWHPKAVKIYADGFVEQDIEGQTGWFDITKGKWIQALLAQSGTELRLYIVTITPIIRDMAYERWPRVLGG
jgi:hypothetical protein